jgi:predicted nucleic acid-binding protein
MLVVDASYLLAILLNELGHEEKIQALTILQTQTLIAPQLLPIEIGNTLLVQVRRKAIKLEYAEEAIDNLKKMNITLFQNEDIDDLNAILVFAERYQLSLYDALYVKLAIKFKAKLASLDKKMLSVAKIVGIGII